MKTNIVKYMIEHNYLKKNAMLNATIGVHGLGAQPLDLAKDLLFEACEIKGRKIRVNFNTSHYLEHWRDSSGRI